MSAYLPLRWESTGDQWWYASPIDWAAAHGHYDLVHELLRLDTNHLIKLTSRRRIQRLETVWDDEQQFHHRSKVARKLLHECDHLKGGKNSLIGAGYGGWLLYTAASAGDLAFVRELLDRDPLLVFGEGEYGVTDILFAAARSKDYKVFKLVLDFAISPRLSGEEEEELSSEVPSAYKSEIMNRAVHASARGGNLQLLKELLGDCADGASAHRDNRGSTILHAAAARGQVEVVKYLTSSSSSSFSDIVNSMDNHGNTALHLAAHRGHLPAVEALLLASPSLIHAKNDSGETFLHSAITGFKTPAFQRLDRQVELMKHLLSNDLFNVKEIINAQDNQGQTALHLAISGNIHSDLVELLMAVDSIDANMRNINGLTPLDMLKKLPVLDSSEPLTRQLLSAGGIFSRQDYMARRAIASHIKRQSVGNSPGTSFRINDSEMFLFTTTTTTTGVESAPCSVGIRSQQCSNTESSSREACNKFGSAAAQRFKHLIRWPKMRNKRKLANSNNNSSVPIPLRQRFGNNNKKKRPLSVGSSSLSPMAAKKKLAAASRSSSFSKISSSSQSSVDMGGVVELESGTWNDDKANDEGGGLMRKNKHGLASSRRLVNQCLCFGDPRQASTRGDLFSQQQQQI